jgi:signal transducing adaptor molecule
MPELTASELAKEAEQEATVFAQAVNVEKLLTMLNAFDPAKDNLADDEELQVRNCFLLTRFQLTQLI